MSEEQKYTNLTKIDQKELYLKANRRIEHPALPLELAD